jgi:dihydrofolate reductase
MKEFAIIASVSKKSFGIGNNGKIPWKINGDMVFFRRTTSYCSKDKQNAVIMGRKTWQSLPKKSKPLQQRINVVISRDITIREKISIPNSVLVVDSLTMALSVLSEMNSVENIFVIGGESIYREAIVSPFCSKIYITEVLPDVIDADTYFPSIPLNYKLTEVSDHIIEDDVVYRFTEYDR